MKKNKKSIRKAQKKDVDIIHKLLDMEPFKYNDDVPYDREWIEVLVTNKKCLTLVYETEGQIKGFISGEKLISNVILLWFCAVKKEYQNKTIGIKLYLEFEKKCKERGINAILAYGYKTSAKMLEKLNFYSNEKMYKEFYKPLEEQLTE
ncbi:MAG: GNAT family N-acetyltransferase [Bacteroidales bacterium]